MGIAVIYIELRNRKAVVNGVLFQDLLLTVSCSPPSLRQAVLAFDDLLEAKQRALDTQKGRRNLDKWELGKIVLKLKPESEAEARAKRIQKSTSGARLPVRSAKRLKRRFFESLRIGIP